MVGRGGAGRRLLVRHLPLAAYLGFLLFPFYWMAIVSR